MIPSHGLMDCAAIVALVVSPEQRDKGTEDDCSLRLLRMRFEEQFGILLNASGDLTRMNRALSESAIEIDHSVSARFVTRVHRIKSIEVDGAGTTGNHAPGPHIEIARCNRRSDGRSMDSVSTLQLANVEAASGS